jgi:hypothetical protein
LETEVSFETGLNSHNIGRFAQRRVELGSIRTDVHGELQRAIRVLSDCDRGSHCYAPRKLTLNSGLIMNPWKGLKLWSYARDIEVDNSSFSLFMFSRSPRLVNRSPLSVSTVNATGRVVSEVAEWQKGHERSLPE